MANANTDYDESPRCNCSSCFVGNRTEDDPFNEVTERDAVCTFMPLLDKGLAEFEIVTKCTEPRINTVKYFTNEWNPTEKFSDEDAHICYHYDWITFCYGSKLSKATSVNDPELVKLRNLFEFLDPNSKYDQPWWMTA
jgi:hypothetical protein